MSSVTLSKRSLVELTPAPGSNPKFDTSILTAARDLYNAEKNPNGYIFCSIAENKLNFDLLRPKLEHDPNFSQDLTNYSMFGGMECFKKSIASMLETYIFRCPAGSVKTNHLLVGSGTTSLLEALFFSLCDANDWVIIPSPMYPAFVADARVRACVKVVPASMTQVDSDGNISFRIDVAEFEKIFERASQENARVRAVLLCSPNNPTGTIYSNEELLSVINFCRAKNIHLISDEIYSLSMFSETQSFTSVYELLNGVLGDDIHIVSGFSKDFCLNGYRAGYVYTQNAKLMHYLMKSSVFFSCSNPVQSSLKNILNDPTFLKNYIETNQARIKNNYNLATNLLKLNNIPYLESNSGMFLMLDLRKAMKDNTYESELKVWEEIFDNAKVLINPGKYCLFDQPGFYRFIFTQPEPILLLAIERISKVYSKLLLEKQQQ